MSRIPLFMPFPYGYPYNPIFGLYDSPEGHFMMEGTRKGICLAEFSLLISIQFVTLFSALRQLLNPLPERLSWKIQRNFTHNFRRRPLKFDVLLNFRQVISCNVNQRPRNLGINPLRKLCQK